MKNSTKTLTAILLLVVTIFISCDKDPNKEKVVVAGVAIIPTTLVFEAGATQFLVATVMPENATDKTVAWTSSDTSVVVVDATGKITARQIGSAMITVTTTDGNKTAQCAIEVISPYMTITTDKTTGRWSLKVDAATADRGGCWIDLNNDGEKNEGEGIPVFNNWIAPPVGSQTITVYGKITYFYCSESVVTKIDARFNSALEKLECFSNKLETLDLSRNTALKELHCKMNTLKSLTVARNGKLKYINYFANQTKGSDMTALVNSLPNRNPSDSAKFEVFTEDAVAYPEGNVCTKNDVKIATDKNWKVLYKKGNVWMPYPGS